MYSRKYSSVKYSLIFNCRVFFFRLAVGGDYDYEYEDDSDKLAFLDTAKELVADVGDTVTFPCNAHKCEY